MCRCIENGVFVTENQQCSRCSSLLGKKYPRVCARNEIFILLLHYKYSTMDQNIIYVHFEGYLKQWLINRLGNPVRFNRGSYENAILKIYISKHVPSDQDYVLHDNNMIPVIIPRIEGKPWPQYRYLGRRGRTRLADAVETLFRIDMWNSCAKYITNKNFQEQIEKWCKSRGICSDYWGAVMKKFYRMRQSYVKRGIVLGKTYSKIRGVN